MLAVPARDLEVRGSRSVTVAGAAPKTGQETVFSLLVLTASAFVRRDGTVQADAWLPDLVRLGIPETYLGDGVIEKIAAKDCGTGGSRCGNAAGCCPARWSSAWSSR
jgi:hypothetical protein